MKETKKTLVHKYGIFEIALNGPTQGNPFADVRLRADFKYGDRTVSCEGFYDGDGVYKVRLMPDRIGEWSYAVKSSCGALNGITGGFECVEAENWNRGPVRVAHGYHFAYDDGTRFIPVGTTCYAWTHQGEKLEQTTLETLSRSPFNKIRFCVFPKHYDFNHNEPELYPFAGSPQSGWNFERFNTAYFRHIEKRIGDLQKLGIQADLILFHPYDRWGFSKMGREADIRYLKYTVRRLASFSNVWWSLANEYDLVESKEMSDWDAFFKTVEECDPYQHLRSVHNCRGFYDHRKPWVTHCSIQSSELSKIGLWRDMYEKPVVVDECCYEGNLSREWGNLTAQDMVLRFWNGFTLGGYVGHGETYDKGDDVIWWSKGGSLYGQSPGRIAFLKKIMEEMPDGGLAPVTLGKDAKISGGIGDSFFLVDCADYQPAYKDLVLPSGKKYKIDLIDVWNMTVTTLKGVYEGNCRVTLPGKRFIVLRIAECGAAENLSENGTSDYRKNT